MILTIILCFLIAPSESYTKRSLPGYPCCIFRDEFRGDVNRNDQLDVAIITVIKVVDIVLIVVAIADDVPANITKEC